MELPGETEDGGVVGPLVVLAGSWEELAGASSSESESESEPESEPESEEDEALPELAGASPVNFEMRACW